MSEVNMWSIEKTLYDEGIRLICGVDEAGRGPLAGPVCAAAVSPNDAHSSRMMLFLIFYSLLFFNVLRISTPLRMDVSPNSSLFSFSMAIHSSSATSSLGTGIPSSTVQRKNRSIVCISMPE